MFDVVSNFIKFLFRPLVSFVEGLYPFGGFPVNLQPWVAGLGTFFTALFAMFITLIAVRFVAKLM